MIISFSKLLSKQNKTKFDVTKIGISLQKIRVVQLMKYMKLPEKFRCPKQNSSRVGYIMFSPLQHHTLPLHPYQLYYAGCQHWNSLSL